MPNGVCAFSYLGGAGFGLDCELSRVVYGTGPFGPVPKRPVPK